MSLASRTWHALRYDIGRKVTALVLAIGVWFVLEDLVLEDWHGRLDVTTVSSIEEADLLRAQTNRPGIYVIVPDTLILKETKPDKVSLNVKGKKEDVEVLDMSAYVQLTLADLGAQDEAVINSTLSRESFKSRGDPPNLTSFRIGGGPTANLQLTVARKATLSMSLGPGNVQVAGQPAKGTAAERERASVQPNAVDVSGPQSVIDRFRADPGAFKLAPVAVDGRAASVTQLVAKADSEDNRFVTLLTRDFKVSVTVPIVQAPMEVQLFALPVKLNAEELLKSRHLRMVESERPPATIDVLVRGPQSELGSLKPEDLAKRIYLILDFQFDGLIEGTQRASLRAVPFGLSDAVKVFGVDRPNEPPQVQFKLEKVPEGP